MDRIAILIRRDEIGAPVAVLIGERDRRDDGGDAEREGSRAPSASAAGFVRDRLGVVVREALDLHLAPSLPGLALEPPELERATRRYDDHVALSWTESSKKVPAKEVLFLGRPGDGSCANDRRRLSRAATCERLCQHSVRREVHDLDA